VQPRRNETATVCCLVQIQHLAFACATRDPCQEVTANSPAAIGLVATISDCIFTPAGIPTTTTSTVV
jgi:hypothetical protein